MVGILLTFWDGLFSGAVSFREGTFEQKYHRDPRTRDPQTKIVYMENHPVFPATYHQHGGFSHGDLLVYRSVYRPKLPFLSGSTYIYVYIL